MVINCRNIFLVLLLGVMFILTACGDKDVQKEVKVAIYFSKMSDQTIVTEKVYRVANKEQDVITYTINELLKGPTDNELDSGYYSEIPPNTKLLGVINDPVQVRINLSKDFVSGGGSNSVKMRLKELTDTVLAVVPEKPVYIDIEGEQLELLGGEGQEVPEPLVKDINKHEQP